MIDTSVIIDAFKGFTGDQDKDARAARYLLGQHNHFFISSVTYAELLSFRSKRQLDFVSGLPVNVKAFDMAAATLAANVTNRARQEGLLCERCYGIKEKPPPVCKVCNLQVAQQQRLNDIYIAATAQIHGIGLLYVHDGGFVALDQYFPKVTILRPPTAPPEQVELELPPESQPIPIRGKTK